MNLFYDGFVDLDVMDGVLEDINCFIFCLGDLILVGGFKFLVNFDWSFFIFNIIVFMECVFNRLEVLSLFLIMFLVMLLVLILDLNKFWSFEVFFLVYLIGIIDI